MGKRYNNLAIYRIIAAIAIIQFHIFFITYDRDIPYESLLSKAVQGLTALSGFLYAKKRIDDPTSHMLSSLKKLIVPALACAAFMALWNLCYLLATGATNYLALFFDRREYNGSLLFQPGNYYYLLYIFICYAITPLLEKPKSREKVALIACITELAVSFVFGLAIIVIPYIVGYLVGSRHFDEFTDTTYKPRTLITLVLVHLASLGLYAALVTFPFGFPMSTLNFWLFSKNIAASAVGTSSLFLIAYILKWLNRWDEPKLLQYTDRLGLTVFLMNQAFLCGAMDVTAIFPQPPTDIAAVYLFTIGSAIIIDLALELLSRMKKRSTI